MRPQAGFPRADTARVAGPGRYFWSSRQSLAVRRPRFRFRKPHFGAIKTQLAASLQVVLLNPCSSLYVRLHFSDHLGEVYVFFSAPNTFHPQAARE